MSLTGKTTEMKRSRPRYHQNAYRFVFEALRYTQTAMGREIISESDEEEAHISGQDLLYGIRDLALQQCGLLTATVFRHWGIRETADFGRIVFELIERGEMRKTDRDQLSDFIDVYDFSEVFDRDYSIDTREAFK